jgi:hypothetical protein
MMMMMTFMITTMKMTMNTISQCLSSDCDDLAAFAVSV